MIKYIFNLTLLIFITNSCQADFGILQHGMQISTETNSILVSKENYQLVQAPQKSIPQAQGDYLVAAAYGDKAEIAWAKKFTIVELGNINDKRITYQLLQDNNLLEIPHHIAYEWMPAFYYYTTAKNNDFAQWVYNNKERLTLNPNGPFNHCKSKQYDWCQEYYYNFADEELLSRHINELKNNLNVKGFNGLFFDWGSGSFIDEVSYQSIKAYFQTLNQNKTYLQTVSNFYQKLHQENIFVVTNQAFRHHEALLPYVSYDMTESYITSLKDKQIRIQLEDKGWVDTIKTTNYYPIYQTSKDINDSLNYINLLESYKNKYAHNGFKNFIYLNYLAPEYEKIYTNTPLYRLKKPKNGIYFSYAMAKLTNSFVYAEVPQDKTLERDDVYLYQLGTSLGSSYEKINGMNAYIRFYEKGFVVASDAYKSNIYLKIKSPFIRKNSYVWNLYDKNWLKSDNSNSLVIELKFQKDTFEDINLPLGRVYLYL